MAGLETKRHVSTQNTDSVAVVSANISYEKEVVEDLFTTFFVKYKSARIRTEPNNNRSNLPRRVKPPSYANICVDELSCYTYVTDALGPTKKLSHINTLGWVDVVERWNPFQELNFTCSVHSCWFYWELTRLMG
jgi:hypothetical protein